MNPRTRNYKCTIGEVSCLSGIVNSVVQYGVNDRDIKKVTWCTQYHTKNEF